MAKIKLNPVKIKIGGAKIKTLPNNPIPKSYVRQTRMAKKKSKK